MGSSGIDAGGEAGGWMQRRVIEHSGTVSTVAQWHASNAAVGGSTTCSTLHSCHRLDARDACSPVTCSRYRTFSAPNSDGHCILAPDRPILSPLFRQHASPIRCADSADGACSCARCRLAGSGSCSATASVRTSVQHSQSARRQCSGRTPLAQRCSAFSFAVCYLCGCCGALAIFLLLRELERCDRHSSGGLRCAGGIEGIQVRRAAATHHAITG